MGSSLVGRLVERGFLIRSLQGFQRRRLTARGRFLFWTAALVGLLGLDTRRALVFVLFCAAAAPLLLALPQLARRAPRVRLAGRIPSRLTAGRSLAVAIELAAEGARSSGPLSLAWAGPPPEGLVVSPRELLLELAPGRPRRAPLSFVARARGRYQLPALLVAHTDAFGLLRSKSRWLPSTVLLAYPRFFALEALDVRLGRRYQPGGIPLASEVGESLEFVGTREYREGDPPRKIDWKSWARLGRPVVKEYQEEYFSRLALVLDTFLSPRPSPLERRRFEAAISTLASVVEQLGRSERVVDVLAAGPDLYEVSTGRSLGCLDEVLEVLACLEPCPGPPFETIGPALFERLERLTSVVAVMLEWDEPREAFLRRLRDLGVAVHVLLVHEGRTRTPWPRGVNEVADVVPLTPAEVEARIEAGGDE